MMGIVPLQQHASQLVSFSHAASRNFPLIMVLDVQEQEGDDKQGFRRIERGFGKFVRRFQLPDDTDPEHIQVRTSTGSMFQGYYILRDMACRADLQSGDLAVGMHGKVDVM